MVFCLFQFLSIFLTSLRFQVNSIVTVPLTCVNMWLWNFIWPSCLVCEIHCKMLYGLLDLLCEKCDSFSILFFYKVFIHWGTCFARTRLSRQLPVCLVYAYVHFDTSVFRLCLLIKYFSFILLHLSFDCIVPEIFFFYHGAFVFRLQLRIDFIWEVWTYTWLLSMVTELVLQFFLLLYTKCLVKDFLIARHGFILSIFVDVCVFWSSN